MKYTKIWGMGGLVDFTNLGAEGSAKNKNVPVRGPNTRGGSCPPIHFLME